MTIKQTVEKILGFEVIEVTGTNLFDLETVSILGESKSENILVESLGVEGYFYVTQLDGTFLSYYKKTSDVEALEKEYKEWLAVSLEMLKDGMSGGVDSGNGSAREDFTNFANLDTEITFEEMLYLERTFKN